MNNKSIKKKGVFCGIITGFVNGFFGGGGGMICVPMLTGVLKLNPKQAHATAIFFILPLSVASGIFYAAAKLFPVCGWWIVLGVTLGGAVGASLLARISEGTAKWVFTVVMALSGVYLLLF